MDAAATAADATDAVVIIIVAGSARINEMEMARKRHSRAHTTAAPLHCPPPIPTSPYPAAA